MDLAPRTTAAFDSLIAALGEIRDSYVLAAERFTDPLDVVEGYRYVTQLLAVASGLFCEADPRHPRFVSIVDPGRKLQGDNPDAIYHFCRIRGDQAYRIRGRIGEQCYTSFTIHGAAADGGMAGPLLGDVNDRALHVGDDGRYELILGPTRPAGDGDWLRLEPGAHSVIVRSYFQLDPSVQLRPEIAVDLTIEPLGESEPAPPLDDATFAARLGEGVALLRQATLGQALPGQAPTVPFVAAEPNTLPVPFSFRATGLPVPGAADIFYASGRWDLADDEALVMSGTLPPAAFVNVMLWNKHMQTLDYRTHRSSLNRSQIRFEPDGSYRIVVAHSDPGVPNWLDTEGHRTGTIFWRYLLPEQDPSATRCEVVPLGSLAGP